MQHFGKISTKTTKISPNPYSATNSGKNTYFAFDTFYFPETAMEVKSILIIVVLNIILPTLDTFTDINLVYSDVDSIPTQLHFLLHKFPQEGEK